MNLKIQVNYFSSLRDITDRKNETIELKNDRISLNGLLEHLTGKYGNRFMDYIYGENRLKVKTTLKFLVNGNSIYNLGGTETRLNDGDILSILPALRGGQL
jgi:MoaD family protein